MVVTRPVVRQGTGLMPEGPSVPEEQTLGAAVWQLVSLEGATGEAALRLTPSPLGRQPECRWHSRATDLARVLNLPSNSSWAWGQSPGQAIGTTSKTVFF